MTMLTDLASVVRMTGAKVVEVSGWQTRRRTSGEYATSHPNHVMWHHRALAAVLGVVLRLPPVARAMATEQVKSRYLEALVLKFS